MDIFEEIKEAVLASTPGEDTRNYYRNQGVQLERDRIITLLEEKLAILDKIDSGYGNGSELNSIRTKSISSVIALIKGDNNA